MLSIAVILQNHIELISQGIVILKIVYIVFKLIYNTHLNISNK